MAYLRKSGAPTKNTVGALGDVYVNVDNGEQFELIEITGFDIYGDKDDYTEYVWQRIKNRSIEPSDDDIPKVFFTGTAPTTKAEDELPLVMEYHSKTLTFKSYVTLKVQGDTSSTYPKKNFNLKMFKDSERTEKDKRVFRNWANTNKFCLKANWIDITHARNIVNGRLWGEVARTRADYQDYPQEYIGSTNCGAVDGFPIKVYLNGVYQGRYTWNIRKDESMWNMDDKSGKHAALIADNSNLITVWRETPKIDGTDWTDELNDVVPDTILTSFQNAYDFVMNSTDEEFKANIENHFYLSSLIDYYVFIYSIFMYGGLAKSQTFLTYDGKKYLANIYDMDTTWALHWDGTKFYDVYTPCPSKYSAEIELGVSNLLYERIATLYPEKIKTRYEELRNSVLSTGNVINDFERFMDIMPPHLIEEDYAITTADGDFTEIPSKETNTIQKLREIITKRLNYCDSAILGSEMDSPYALKSGTKTFNDGTVVTVNGNHVQMKIGDNMTGTMFVNFYDVAANTDNSGSDTNVNNQPVWFRPIAGETIETTLSNIVTDVNISDIILKANYRDINGVSVLRSALSVESIEDVKSNETLSTPFNVACIFLYVSPSSTLDKIRGKTIEFDLDIVVNGVKYV